MKKTILLILSLAMLIPLLATNLKDGELLVFDIKYGLVSAAEASLELSSTRFGGKDAWQIKSNTRTYSFFDVFFKVRDSIESIWQKDGLKPLRFTKRLQEGNYQQHRVHLFDHDKLSTSYQRWDFKKSVWNTETMDIPAGTQDVLTAFYWVRTQNLVPGRSLFLNITSDGRSMDTEVVVHRKETINSIFGKRECLVIEPKLAGDAVFKQSGRIFIWVTNDAHKIPLKMESKITFGSFVALLKSAKNTGLN